MVLSIKDFLLRGKQEVGVGCGHVPTLYNVIDGPSQATNHAKNINSFPSFYDLQFILKHFND